MPREKLSYETNKTYRSVYKAVDDGLIEALGSGLALAVRLSMGTRIPLNDPAAFGVVLEDLVGDRADDVIRRIEKKLLEIDDGAQVRRAGSVNFIESILRLRSHYAGETLERYK